MHGRSEAGNGKATDDTDYSNVPGGPTPHMRRKNSSAIRIRLRLPLAGKLGWSAPAAPLRDGKCMRTDRSLVRNERHYPMDKKNDHSCKHGQRDSLIDTSAANHCYAFHSFPSQTKVRVLTCLLSRCTASVNEPLRACASPAVFQNRPRRPAERAGALKGR